MDNDINPSAADTQDFVNLQRTLSDIPLTGELTDDSDFRPLAGSGRRHAWHELADEMRVIVLAEAGAGKTREIAHLAERLRAEGKHAFFIRLERVANYFEVAFEPPMYADFQAWLSGNAEGWLLVDSVDEARLRHPADFEVAIRTLAAKLAGATARSHIILTSRIGAWRPATDLALVRDLLPHPSPGWRRLADASEPNSDENDDNFFETVDNDEEAGEEIAPGFVAVGLDDLNEQQVARFAAAKGVADTRAFVEAIEKKEATAFTARPQDLEDVVHFWRENNRIGSRWEMMEANVTRRLTERDQTRAEAAKLAADRALSGARALAAAATLTGIPVISVPDGASASDEGINPLTVLPDWSIADIGTLLQRPIFDGAIYGTVRFHHRSVREYLAAEWFAALLREAPNKFGLELLFFRKKFGIEVLAPLLRPLVPWMLILDPSIRRRAMEIAPEIVFEGGDPSRLPLLDRQRILSDVCRQIADGTADRSTLDYAAVQRFSSDDLADDIRRLLLQYRDHDEIAPFLLRMVWLGELRDALPEVRALAVDSSDHGYRRLTAVRALHAIADEGQLAEIRAMLLAEPGDIDRRLVAEFVTGLPEAGDVSWFLAAAERSLPKQKYSIDELASATRKYVDRIGLDRLPDLVAGLDALLHQAPVIERRHNEVSVRFEWLLGSAARLLVRLIESHHSAALSEAGMSIIRTVSLARANQSDELTDKRDMLAVLVPQWPQLNRTQFWYDVDHMRQALPPGERLVEWWLPSNYGVAWKFTGDDFEFALEAMTSRPLLDDRLVALSLAFELYRTNGRPRGWLAKLKRAAVEPDIAGRLSELLHPAPNLELKRHRAQQRRWAKQSERRERQDAVNLERSREYLATNVSDIRSELELHPETAGSHGAMQYLFNRLQDNRSTSRWSDYDWTKLRGMFGDSVAEMFRDAARRYWRHSWPRLHSEGAPANETQFSTILGLAGLEIETSENPAILQSFNDREVLIAARHAVSELNGFPAWFSSLFELHPVLVADFLFSQIRYEAMVIPEDQNGNGILSDVSWSGQWAWPQLGPMLVELLLSSEPSGARALNSILKILKGSSIPDTDLIPLARLHALNESAVHPSLWFATWIGVDPDNAITAFEARLVGLPSSEATDLAMRTAVGVFGNRFNEPSVARDGFLRPRALSALHAILHRFIRREDDISRANSGAYSPGLRDHAQEARDSILDRLRDARGKDAFVALQAIVEDHPNRPWLRRLLVEKAQQEGDISTFESEEVLELTKRFERSPRSADQLADTALLRLLQLKERVEVQGTLPAEAAAINEDDAANNFLVRDLQALAGTNHSVIRDQESGTAALLGVGYSSTQRISALVVPYGNKLHLRDWPQSRNALDTGRRRTLALFHTTRHKGWRLPWSEEPSLERAVIAAEARWQAVEKNELSIDDVDIVGIDLTKSPSLPPPRDPLDRFLDFLRWRWQTSVLKLGVSLALLGGASLTGWIQGAIEVIVERLFGIALNLPEVASSIGWTLVAIGVLLALVGHFLQRR